MIIESVTDVIEGLEPDLCFIVSITDTTRRQLRGGDLTLTVFNKASIIVTISAIVQKLGVDPLSAYNLLKQRVTAGLTGGSSSPFMTMLQSKAQSSSNVVLQSATLPSTPVTFSSYAVSISHSAFPTSTPTSTPTISCYPGGYVTTENICERCENGMMSDGYHSKACYDCPAGSFANFITGTCDLCIPGTFSPAKSMSCQLCPLNTFTSQSGTETCQICPSGRVTPGLGSASSKLCVSPTTNFLAGIVFLLIAAYLVFTIVVSQFHVTTFLRKARIVRKLLDDCVGIMKDVDRLKSGSDITILRNNNSFTVDSNNKSAVEVTFKGSSLVSTDKFRFCVGQTLTINGIEDFKVTEVITENTIHISYGGTSSLPLDVQDNIEITVKSDSLLGKFGYDDEHKNFSLFSFILGRKQKPARKLARLNTGLDSSSSYFKITKKAVKSILFLFFCIFPDDIVWVHSTTNSGSCSGYGSIN